ncbi:unnamed protein product [Mytilus edulis]|uniref:ATP-dependent DNA helicase n=1 Tax=Mytilus edulis TaxID=6550 RepID=A0A8S3R4E8_MYTED|nr:unnamed protein product [Mytilus edulis]
MPIIKSIDNKSLKKINRDQELQVECIEQGIKYELPNINESAKEYQKRCLRIKRRIKIMKNKKTAQISHTSVNNEHFNTGDSLNYSQNSVSTNTIADNPVLETHNKTNMTNNQTEKDLDLQTKCRKLGLTYDPPVENETPDEYKKRCLKNYNKIKYKLNKLNINFETIPDPPPFADDEHFNKAVNCIRSFELQEMSYTIDVCSVCFERKINLKKKHSVCERCFKDKVVIKMFSTENNMNPGEVPLELANLSVVEEQLISRISPCINIHMLKHGGIAANGHCVAFPQEVNEPGKILPKLPSEVNIIRVRKIGKNDTSKEFNVRRQKVQIALIWLKKNNPAYSDIEISEERLNLLPEDGQIQNIHTLEYNSNVGHLNDQGPAPKQIDPGNVEGETISSVLLPEPCFDIKQKIQDAVDEIATEENTNISINKKGQVSIPWPTRGKIPLSEFTTRHFFTLAFPCLFPHACADFHMNRPLTCSSMSDWANHLIWYKDGRFAKHKFFKFIVHNIINRKRVLDNSTFIVQQKLGENMLTLSDLKAKLQTGDKSVAEKILYFSANLRGTSQYWNQRSKELRALIQYKINEGQGLPSFFTTGSCAEFYFKPLKRILSLYIKETTGNEIDLNDHNKMFKAVQDNTHIVGDYFDKRTQSYFKEIMGPVFGVNSYWYRQEFSKSRGMIHWHGLCWRFDKEPHNLMHQAYVDGKTDDECAKLLSDWAKLEYKMTANHPAGLDENNKPKKIWPPPEGTAPAPPDEKNPLNKLLMDVSESQESILEDHLLLCNRINLHRCSDYCLRAPRNNPSNPVKQCRMEFGTSLNPGKTVRDNPAIVKDRNGSLRLEMERDHLIWSNILKYTHRHGEQMIKPCISKYKFNWCTNTRKNGSTATKLTPLDKYLSRPENDHCSWYNYICKSGKVPVISGGSLRATCPLTENYCKNTLILHWHDWRKFSDIKDDNVSWNDLFRHFLLTDYCPNFVKADVERANNAAQNGLVDDESDDDNSEFENMSQPEWIQVIKPNAEFTDNSEFKFDDGGPDYNWSVTNYNYPADLGVKFIENLKIEESISVDELSFNTDINISSLNEDQMFAFNLVMKALFDFQNNPLNFTPLRLIVGGSAGCGKTYLIKCLVKAVKCFFNTNKCVQVLCPTGNSANLIDGVTIHSFLKIPTTYKSKEMKAPDGSTGEILQKNCEGLKVLIVDERSLIGCTTLGWMEYMCRCAVQKV